jgi:ArsR family transcriptional regulator, lead/cadmium/zinc/bismuth-responsive transcriptional repressor
MNSDSLIGMTLTTPQPGGQVPTPVDAAALDGCDVRLVDPERVYSVRAGLPDQDTIVSMATVVGLLSDPSRLRLLLALLEGGEMCVCDIAAACGSSESSISHALRLLRANRVVRVRRSGRRAFYQLADSHVRLLLDVTLAHAAHGATCSVRCC